MPSVGISLMAPKPKLFYSDTTKAKLASYTHRPWGVEYCETDFRLNGGRTVNKPACTVEVVY